MTAPIPRSLPRERNEPEDRRDRAASHFGAGAAMTLIDSKLNV